MSYKHNFFVLIVMAVVLCSCLCFFAGCSPNYELVFELAQDGQSYVLVDVEFPSDVEPNDLSLAINIPSEYQGLPVSAIGNDVFAYSRYLIRVSIPNSVTSIGDNAFYYCHNLNQIDLPENLVYIGEEAFCGFKGTSINLPSSLTYIGSEAFVEAKITSVTIPANTELGEYVFQHCDDLKTATFEQGATSTGVRTFDNSSLTTVVLPNSIETISEGSFSECFSLTSINIPESVRTIEERAFSGCSILTSITLPNSLEVIGDFAFTGLSFLESISIPQVDSIGNCAFEYCMNLSTITLAEGIGSFNASAFYNTQFYNSEENWEGNLLYIGTYLISSKPSIIYGEINYFNVKPGTLTITSGAFAYTVGTGIVRIPASVTRVCKDAIWAPYNVECEAESQPDTWATDWYYSESSNIQGSIYWGQPMPE